MDKSKVSQWLFSIPRTELAIKNLEQSLEILETRYQSPPSWMSNPSALGVMGGINESFQENWVEFIEAYPARKSFLLDKLQQYRRKVALYYEALDAMERESWGKLGRQIVDCKYYRHASPDRKIYSLMLFCSERTYFRTLDKALRFIGEVMIGEF